MGLRLRRLVAVEGVQAQAGSLEGRAVRFCECRGLPGQGKGR